MNFDEMIDRRGTNSSKWDGMEKSIGVSAEDGIAMWVADMDFRAPDFLQAATQHLLDQANYGYFTGVDAYFDAAAWWMQTRHGWAMDPSWLFVTFGLGNGIGLALQSLTEPGDEIVTFTPVYHEFARKITKGGRVVRELPLQTDENGLYRMDFDHYDTLMSGREKMVLFCSPHNPAGRVWSQAEIDAFAAFCLKHDLLVVSDEIHHDLIFPGQTHLPLHVAAPQLADRLIMMTSASKTFNIAGARTGLVAIPDPALRARFGALYTALDMSPNLHGVRLSQAAYSPAGAEWVDALNRYLADNATHFINGINALPGLAAMPMQSTYLAWVNFAGTGMERAEFAKRVAQDARIGATPGHTLGTGGETFLRFNLGTPRARIDDALGRLQSAFADLQ